ncbi:MAG: ABC transporter permease, partial [Chloroflexota bacterium]
MSTISTPAEQVAGVVAASTSRRRARFIVGDVAQLFAFVVLIAFVLVPIYWMISTSLKTTNQTFAIPPVFVFTPTVQHYQAVFTQTNVPHSLANSLIVASGSTIIALLLGVPAAYGLARFRFRGRADLWFWFISNRFISPIVVALPVFLLARDLGLLNSRLALVLIYLTFNVPLVVWLCVDQFRAVPREVDDAALVDGAGRWRVFREIALPLATPGVVVSAILCFIFSWNE